jgi:Lrp/AsnC family transcriptional regulator, leucine-responsive regulatory protein
VRSPATLTGSAAQPIETSPAETQNYCVPRRVALDEIDLDLLDLLQRDAGRTLRELGEVVGLSPSAVHRRLVRYHTTGLITRHVALLDPEALGGSLLAVVLVTLESESTQDHASLRERLAAAPEVQQCYDVAGEWDYVIVLVTRDMPHCRELVDRLFLDGLRIKRLATLPVFDSVKRGLDLPMRGAGRES